MDSRDSDGAKTRPSIPALSGKGEDAHRQKEMLDRLMTVAIEQQSEGDETLSLQGLLGLHDIALATFRAQEITTMEDFRLLRHMPNYPKNL